MYYQRLTRYQFNMYCAIYLYNLIGYVLVEQLYIKVIIIPYTCTLSIQDSHSKSAIVSYDLASNFTLCTYLL